jgi:hypothetical protein
MKTLFDTEGSNAAVKFPRWRSNAAQLSEIRQEAAFSADLQSFFGFRPIAVILPASKAALTEMQRRRDAAFSKDLQAFLAP